MSFVPHIPFEHRLPLLRTPMSLNPSCLSKRNPRMVEGRQRLGRCCLAGWWLPEWPLSNGTRWGRGQHASAKCRHRAWPGDGSAARPCVTHAGPGCSRVLNWAPAHPAGYRAHPYMEECWLTQHWVRQNPKQRFWPFGHKTIRSAPESWLHEDTGVFETPQIWFVVVICPALILTEIFSKLPIDWSCTG